MGCDCVKSSSISTDSVDSSLVTWDGGTLCFAGSTYSNINEVIVALSNFACALSTSLSNILPTDDTNITISAADFSTCLSISEGETLHSALIKIIDEICTLKTSVETGVSSSLVSMAGLTGTNCLSITNGETLTSAMVKLIAKVCTTTTPAHFEPFNIVHFADFSSGELMSSPLNPFTNKATSSLIIGGTTGSAPTAIMSTSSYNVDGVNVDKSGETITLTGSADNYIYLDRENNFAYTNSATTIGGTAPTVSGVVIAKVTTNLTTVASITREIAQYPVDGTMIADTSITARHINSTALGKAIVKDGVTGKIDLNTGAGLGIGSDSNVVYISSVSKGMIYSDVASVGLQQNGDGSLSTLNAKSITTSSGANQLVNDVTTPGDHYNYGTSATGTKGWYEADVIHDTITITAAQFKAMATTPIMVLPVVSGSFYKIIDCSLHTDFNTVAYTEGSSGDIITLNYNNLTTQSSKIYEFSESMITLASGVQAEQGLKNVSLRQILEGYGVSITTTHDTIANGLGQYGDGVYYLNIWYKPIYLRS